MAKRRIDNLSVSLAKEGSWIVLGQAMAVIGTLVGVRVLTGMLTPDNYGALALGLTFAALANQTILGPLANGVARFYAPAVVAGDLGGFFETVYRLMFRAGVLVALSASLIAGTLISLQLNNWAAIAASAAVFSILSGCSSILSGILNASRQRPAAALHQGSEAWARFLFAAGLLLFFRESVVAVVVGYSVASALVLGSLSHFLTGMAPFSRSDAESCRRWNQEIFQYSWPFASWGVFTWAQAMSDRWALGLFSTNHEVGLYTALFQLGYYPISIGTGILVQFLAPIFYEQISDDTTAGIGTFVTRTTWIITFLVLALTAIGAILALILHRQIFDIFVSKQYGSVSFLLPWIITASGIFSAGQVLTLKLMSEMKTKEMVSAKITTALIGVVLNFLFTYFWGVQGTVASGLIFSLMFLAWSIVLSIRSAENVSIALP